jgi:hypothetical protein
MNSITLTLSPEEAAGLLQFIDAAVRGEGLRAARAAVLLSEKIEQARQQAAPVAQPTRTEQ